MKRLRCLIGRHDWVRFELYERLNHPTSLGQIIHCPARRCRRCNKTERIS